LFIYLDDDEKLRQLSLDWFFVVRSYSSYRYCICLHLLGICLSTSVWLLFCHSLILLCL